IVSQPNLRGAVSDESRDKTDQLLRSDYTYKQLYDSAQILVQDAVNRKTGFEQQIAGLKRLMASAPIQFNNGGGGGGQGGDFAVVTGDGVPHRFPTAEARDSFIKAVKDAGGTVK